MVASNNGGFKQWWLQTMLALPKGGITQQCHHNTSISQQWHQKTVASTNNGISQQWHGGITQK
jgi:hypothetical protein